MNKTRLIAILILIPFFVPIITITPAHGQVSYPPVRLTVNPTLISFSVGSSGASQINVTSWNGFSGPVTLQGSVSPYPQLNVTLNPPTFTLTPGGTVTATATVSANSTTTPATYRIGILARADVYQVNTIFNATVTPATTLTADFRLTTSLSTVPVTPGTLAFVTISAISLAGFSGDVSLTDLPQLGTFNATILHVGTGHTANATFTLAGPCPSPPAALPQIFEIDGHNGARLHWLTLQYYYPINQPMFCLNFNQFQKIVIGSSSINYVSIGTVGGFTGNIILTTQTSFQTAFFPSNNVSIPQNSSPPEILLAITVPANTAPGNHTLGLTASSGSQIWKMNETIQAITGQDYFTMTVNPSAMTISQGSTRNLIISLTGQAGFQRHVWIYASTTTTLTGGITFTPYPSISDIIVTTGQTTQVTFVMNVTGAPPGNYALLLQAQSLYMPYVNAIQIVPITVQAAPLPDPDVSIISNPSTVKIQAGSSSTIKLSIAGMYGFVGNVLIECRTSLPAVNCWLDSSYMLLDNVNKTITLIVSTDPTLNSGTYPVIVSIEAFAPIGSRDPNIARSMTVNLVVTSPNILGVPPTVFYAGFGAIAGVGAAAAVTGFLLLRMRKLPKTSTS